MFSEKGDILTEMRFYVPNNELEMIEEEKKGEESKEEKKKAPKKAGGSDAEESD